MSAPAPASQETELRQELSLVQQAAVVKIVDQATYDEATDFLTRKIIPFRKKWKEYWDPLKKVAKAAHTAVCDKFNEGDEPAEKAEKAVKAEIGRWDAEQERIRQEAQRKAQQEAERQERERRDAEAFFAEQAGVPDEQVQAIVEAPAEVVAAPVALGYERTSAVSSRDNWVCEVTDLKKLCAAVAKGTVPLNFVVANQTALNARARADQDTMNVPGCKAKNNKIITGRAR